MTYGSTWVTETLEGGGGGILGSMGSVALALDSNDNPHIVWHGDIFYGYVRYAWWTDTEWIRDNVGYAGNSFTPTAIAVDRQGHAHIAYHEPYGDGLMYAHHSGYGSWEPELITAEKPPHLDLALNTDDIPSVIYESQETGALVLAQRLGDGTWSEKIIDDLGGSGASLRFNKDDNTRVAYSEGGDLKFAWHAQQAIVPPAGGTLQGYGTATLEFPAGAFTDTVTLTYAVAQRIGTYPDVGVFYDIGATLSDGSIAEIAAGHAYTVVVSYDQAAVPYGLNETDLALHYWSDEDWVREPTSQVDVVQNKITATPNHLSLWAGLFGKRFVYLPFIVR